MQDIYTIEEVFGTTRKLPLNYVDRQSVDKAFVDSLSRDRHVVLHGSSKTGKSCLRQNCMQEADALHVHCLSGWSISALSEAILKAAGYETKRSESQTVSGSWKIFAKAKASLFGNGAEGGADSQRKNENSIVKEPIEIDPSDVNDLISSLDSVEAPRFITLEDFHYLPEEVQKEFSVFLKAVHENSRYVFVIVGVWLEEDRLGRFNGDLTGRVTSINADEWDTLSLDTLINNSEQLLNIRFNQGFREELVAFCLGSVYLAQEVLYKACHQSDVERTCQETRAEIGSELNAVDLARAFVNQSSGRFNGFLSVFADGFQDTKLEMHRYVLASVVQSNYEELSRGLRMRDIKTWINEHHPNRPVNTGNITQALQSMSALQVKKDQKPIILDYDGSSLRLHVVDKAFLLWLEYQNRSDLMDILEVELVAA